MGLKKKYKKLKKLNKYHAKIADENLLAFLDARVVIERIENEIRSFKNA